MDRGVRQPDAVHAVVGIGRYATDHITRIDVFQIQLDVHRAEMFRDPPGEELADVPEPDVARGVAALRRPALLLLREKFLAGAFRDDDDGMAPLLDPPVQEVQEPTVTVKSEGHFRDEHHVRVAVRQRRVTGQKSRMPAHELHHANTVGRGRRLDVRSPYRLGRLPERRLKTKALVDVGNVVVDRLRDADNSDLVTSFARDPGKLKRAAQRAVTADDEQNGDAHPFQAVNDLLRVLLPA